MNSDTTQDPARCVQPIVRQRGDRWLISFDLEADEWHGCKKTLEEAINYAEEYRVDYYIPADAPVYIALGLPMRKAECEEWGQEWPWYQVDRATALRIHLPNDKAQATPTRHAANTQNHG